MDRNSLGRAHGRTAKAEDGLKPANHALLLAAQQSRTTIASPEENDEVDGALAEFLDLGNSRSDKFHRNLASHSRCDAQRTQFREQIHCRRPESNLMRITDHHPSASTSQHIARVVA